MSLSFNSTKKTYQFEPSRLPSRLPSRRDLDTNSYINSTTTTRPVDDVKTTDDDVITDVTSPSYYDIHSKDVTDTGYYLESTDVGLVGDKRQTSGWQRSDATNPRPRYSVKHSNSFSNPVFVDSDDEDVDSFTLGCVGPSWVQDDNSTLDTVDPTPTVANLNAGPSRSTVSGPESMYDIAVNAGTAYGKRIPSTRKPRQPIVCENVSLENGQLSLDASFYNTCTRKFISGVTENYLADTSPKYDRVLNSTNSAKKHPQINDSREK